MNSPDEQIRKVDEELKDLAQPTDLPKYLFQHETFEYAGPVTFWVQGMVVPRFTMLRLMSHHDEKSRKFQAFGISGMDCYQKGDQVPSSYCFNWIDEAPEESEIHRIIEDIEKRWLDGKEAVEKSFERKGDWTYPEEGHLPGEDYLHGKNRPK